MDKIARLEDGLQAEDCPTRLAPDFFLQERLDLFFRGVLIYHAEVNVCDFTVAINQSSERHAVESEAIGQRLIADHDGIVDALLVEPGPDGFPTIVVHRNSDDDQSLLLILFLKLDEPRNFQLEAVAPGGPEIYKNHFPFLFRKPDVLIVRVLQNKIWRSVTGIFRRKVRLRPRR